MALTELQATNNSINPACRSTRPLVPRLRRTNASTHVRELTLKVNDLIYLPVCDGKAASLLDGVLPFYAGFATSGGEEAYELGIALSHSFLRPEKTTRRNRKLQPQWFDSSCSASHQTSSDILVITDAASTPTAARDMTALCRMAKFSMMKPLRYL